MYFGSERKGSKGKDDIFISQYADGVYQSPVSLGKSINTEEHESTPYMEPNGEYLIFSRNGLWISFQIKEGQWSRAMKMGDSLEGSCPYVSPDGKYLFYLKMGTGYNDVYWVSEILLNN
jgi:hypothetical protein